MPKNDKFPICYLYKKLYWKKQTVKISTTSFGPCEIFEGAITPYKDIRLEIYRAV